MKLLLPLTAAASSFYEASSFVMMNPPAFGPTALRSINDEAHMEVMPKIWDELRKSEKVRLCEWCVVYCNVCFLLSLCFCEQSCFVSSPLHPFQAIINSSITLNFFVIILPTQQDIVIQQQVGEISESEASMAMAERLLETALDYVRTKEHIEEDLATAAHKTFEHAAENEQVLKEHIVADDKLDDIPLDSYLEERFHEAQDTEREAHEDEIEHLNKWAELRMEEEAIKTAIKELKDLNKRMDDLDFMRNNLG